MISQEAVYKPPRANFRLKRVTVEYRTEYSILVQWATAAPTAVLLQVLNQGKNIFRKTHSKYFLSKESTTKEYKTTTSGQQFCLEFVWVEQLISDYC